MNKVFTGRFITVLIATALSVWFVWPTFNYFFFVGSEGEIETPEEKQRRVEMLDSENMINLGLDLQGGVELLFELDTELMVEREMQRTADNLLGEFKTNQVAATVDVDLASREIVVENVANEDVKVAQDIILDYENVLDAGNLDALAADQRVVLTYRTQQMQDLTRDNVEAAQKTLKRRVDEFGLTQPLVVRQGVERILVQIPGETNPQQVRERLLKTANLEFRLLHENHDTAIQQFIDPATGKIRPEFLKEVPVPGVEGATSIVIDHQKVAPLVPANYELFLGRNVETVNGEQIITEGLGYLLRARPELTGENLRRASDYYDPQELTDQFKILLEFDQEGTEKFEEVTRLNIGRRFAIVLDGTAIMAPVIQTTIAYGRCEITGGFTADEARELALLLKSGALPAPLRIISSQEVGASLGVDSITASGRALLVGAIGIIILMVFIYRTVGLVAVLAMLLNVLAILAILALADATLTLSGIGGILLTMGMAVDANVLIYERLREELNDGKPIRAAMSAAFDRAFSVILDSNVTTLLPALVLLAFEIVQDSARGFWMALAIGLIINLYTGLTVTRALIEAYLAKRKKPLERSAFVGTFAFFKNANFDFMKMRKLFFGLSGALVIACIGWIFIKGANPGIDFTGGVVATIESSAADVSRADLERAFQAEYADVKVIRIINTDKYQITVPKTSETQSLPEIKNEIISILNTSFPDQMSLESSQTIESVVGEEFAVGAFFTVLVTALIILGYIALRFRPVFGMGAVLALLHDIIISFGIFAMLGHSLTLDIVSALLIILGYSVNDTIVIFDRVREKMGEMYGRSMGEIINMAINQTLSRTVFTSGTTLLAVLAMYIFGGVGLKDFSLILLLGIISGTYSSIFVASALVYTYITAREKRLGIEKAHGTTKTVKIGS